MSTIYELTIPLFIRSLESQLAFLQKGEKWAEENNVDKSTLLQGRLAPDMKDLTFQIYSTTNYTIKRLPLITTSTLPATAPEDSSSLNTFNDLYALLENTIQIFRALKVETFLSAEHRISVPLGADEELELTTLRFVQCFLVPNFFFHAVTAYDVLRMKGVPVGKKDWVLVGKAVE